MRKENKKGKKGLLMTAGIIVGIIIILIVVIAIIAGKNMKAMNQCMEAALEEVKNHYTVTEVDPGEYKELKIYGIMKFDVEQYHIEEIGNLSVMRVNMGLMQMGTFVITPKDKNLPLLSTDYMYILGNRKAYLELYDLVEEKDAQYTALLTALTNTLAGFEELEDVETTPAWYQDLLTVTSYKGGKADADSRLQEMLTESLKIYMENSKEFPLLDEAAKQEKIRITKEYTDGLIEKGGISTDVFKKALGDEVTREFFDGVFFGTKAE